MKFKPNIFAVAGIIILTVTLFYDLTGRKGGKEKPPEKSVTKVFVPKYEVIDEEKLDAMEKAQINLRILVNLSSEITEDNLKYLLNEIYLTLKNRKDFTYYSSPTHILIYAYTSKEKSGSDWIAMLDKSGDDLEPKITTNKSQLSL